MNITRRVIRMKNKNNLSEDDFRQKVDGFSMRHTDEKTIKNGYKVVDEPLYPDHSVDYNKIKNNK
jgi:hypothetical protein